MRSLKKYDGKENPENLITLYEIVVRSAAGNEHVMANYFPVVLDQAGHQWLLGLPEDSFDSWEELRQAFIDNLIATCEQPGNKYDLERIRDRKNEPLRDYIRRFADMRLKIPKISHDEAISAFIKGLRFHEALRNKLLRERPATVAELLATAKNYANADDVEKLIREDARGADSLHDEMTVVDALTTGTPIAVTTATTEKDGTGDATTATISEASDLVTTTTR